MTDRPILFSAPMVRALLAGTKTQTRRLTGMPKITPTTMPPTPEGWFDIKASGGGLLGVHADEVAAAAADYLTIQPGDRLWVRETIRPQLATNFLTGEPIQDVWEAAYDADGADVVEEAGFNLVPWWNHNGKLPAIHMHRRFSRLTLPVTAVRVERLQDISEADALAEGITQIGSLGFGIAVESESGADRLVEPSPQAAYAKLWSEINGPESWDANPWVAVITFTMLQENIGDAQ